jgi:uncharacterized membrane protein YhaH (DUF805 family)
LNIKTISSIFNHLVSPKSKDSDSARKEFILNTFLVSVIILLIVAVIMHIFNQITIGTSFIYQQSTMSLLSILLILSFFPPPI